VLAGTLPLDVALRRTAQTGLSALAAGVKPATAIRSAAPDIAGLLHQLRDRAEFVLVDAPSWDGRPELVLFSSHCDAVYLIVPETEAECPEANALCQLIPEQGGRLAGCILARF
jgi:Mrp family chromosome partitioning ATPase